MEKCRIKNTRICGIRIKYRNIFMFIHYKNISYEYIFIYLQIIFFHIGSDNKV